MNGSRSKNNIKGVNQTPTAWESAESKEKVKTDCELVPTERQIVNVDRGEVARRREDKVSDDRGRRTERESLGDWTRW